MREILFRGKRADNNEWVYGSLIINGEHDYAIYDCNTHNTLNGVEVVEETIGQFIGINDKDGLKIFDGDILKGRFGTGSGGKSTKYKYFFYSVGYSNHCPEFFIKMPNNYGSYRFCPHLNQSRIAGNIYEHPELLSQQATT